MGVNKERVAKLADLLESGEIKQTERRLRDYDGSMCCLGVACELYRRETGEGKWKGGYFDAGSGVSISHLPHSVKEWYGFNSWDPNLTDEHGDTASAIHWNDSRGRNFKQIAAMFRKLG